MSNTTALQQRLTWRPGYPVDRPVVSVRDLEIVSTKQGTWFMATGEPRERVVPPDFYLPGREMQSLTANDFETISLDTLLDFCREWGIFADKLDRDLDSTSASPQAWTREAVERGWLTETKSMKLRTLMVADELGVNVNDLTHPATLLPRVDGFAMFAEIYGELTSESPVPLGELDLPLIALNSALSAFAPSLEVEGMADLLPQPTVYNYAALQLATDLVEGIRASQCANVTCGQLFTRQRDRVTKGAHRTGGVLYCSKACALAQGQREYRTRQKIAKNLPGDTGKK